MMKLMRRFPRPHDDMDRGSLTVARGQIDGGGHDSLFLSLSLSVPVMVIGVYERKRRRGALAHGFIVSVGSQLRSQLKSREKAGSDLRYAPAPITIQGRGT